MKRRTFIKRGALFVPSIFVPRLIRAQFGPFSPFAPTKIAAAGGGASNSLLTNLIAVWEMDQADDSDAPDATGNGKNLTVDTPTTKRNTHIQGSFSNSGGLSGFWKSTDAAFHGTGSRGISFWINPQGNSPDGLMFCGTWDGGAKGWIIWGVGTVLQLRIKDAAGSSNYNATSTINVNDSNWHHVLGTFNSANATGYLSVDNESVKDTGATDGINNSTDFVLNQTPFYMDESAYWSRVMTFGASSDQSALIGSFNFGSQTGTPLFYSGGGWS